MDKVYWTTKDGRKVDVDDMDLTHLRNTLKMILRNRQKTVQKRPRLNYFTLNGDIAQSMVDDAIQADFEDFMDIDNDGL